MSFNVQSDDGTVADANAYITLAFFKAYHDDRGNDYSAYIDAKLQGAIIRATDYMDTRYAFRGVKLSTGDPGTQTTEWPRRAGSEMVLPWFDINFLTPLVDVNLSSDTFVALVGPDAQEILGIPPAVKRACAEYAFRALAAKLYIDAPPPNVGPMPGRLVDEYSVGVGSGAVTETTKYAPPQSGAFVMPAYPQADLWLARAGLIESGRTLIR